MKDGLFVLLRGWYEELVQRTYRPRLTPVNDLRRSETSENHWHSTGRDPQFRIEPPLPSGWVRLHLKGRAAPDAVVTLHVERSDEPTETRDLGLGSLTPAGSSLDRFVSFRRARSARLGPSRGPGPFAIEEFTLQRVGLWRVVWHVAASYGGRDRRSEVRQLVARALHILRHSGISGLRRAFAARLAFGVDPVPTSETEPKQEDLDGKTLGLTRADVAPAYTPTFSFIAAVRSPAAPQLTKCLEAIKAQLYPRWELCVRYDSSTSAESRAVLERYATEDARIKLIHPISDPPATALQSVFVHANGEFIAIIHTDDQLSPDALPHYVLALNQHRDADLIYGDEDCVDDAGRCFAPQFKPDWSPENLLGGMYIGRACVYRRSLVEQVGCLGEAVGAQEYDLALRVSEITSRIHHIPQVLCHRQVGRDGAVGDMPATADDQRATLSAVRQSLLRRGLRGTVEGHAEYPDHHVVHLRADPAQKVSIVIPTRDRADLLERCLATLFALTTHPNFEVCVVDNGSRDAATFEVLERLKRSRPERFSVIRRDMPFNFSALVNAGVAATDGALVLLLNNDTEILDGSWLEEMAGYAQLPEIGAVGCVLLYPSGLVQHGGVALIPGAVARNSHVGQPLNAPGYLGRLLAQSNYAAVTAACLMVRRDVLMEAGGFDEQLPVAYNDVDFCLRLLGKGYRNVCLGQVRLLHHESVSRVAEGVADSPARSISEFALMRERWATILDHDPYHSPNLGDVTRGPASVDPTPRWIGSPSPALLIAGHSHRYSFIDYFRRSSRNAPIAILDSPLNIDSDSDPYWAFALSEARRRQLPLAIVWDGNRHNAHFLLESDEKFSVFPATGPWEDGRARPLVPRSLIREFFGPSVAGLRAILARSAGVRVIILGTPPPKADDQIRVALRGEAWLAERARRLGVNISALQITPLPVRVELWKITQELLEATCDEFSATFIGVPEAAFACGALAPDASVPDATHANGIWGEVMVEYAMEALTPR